MKQEKKIKIVNQEQKDKAQLCDGELWFGICSVNNNHRFNYTNKGRHPRKCCGEPIIWENPSKPVMTGKEFEKKRKRRENGIR